ncbi:hypothetical protein D9M70_526610 [compost metagenome]
MIERPARPPYAATTFQQLIELRPHGAIHEFQIIHTGNNHIYRHAAPRRSDQRTDEFTIRQKIGRHDQDMLLSN